MGESAVEVVLYSCGKISPLVEKRPRSGTFAGNLVEVDYFKIAGALRASLFAKRTTFEYLWKTILKFFNVTSSYIA